MKHRVGYFRKYYANGVYVNQSSIFFKNCETFVRDILYYINMYTKMIIIECKSTSFLKNRKLKNFTFIIPIEKY